MWCTLGREMTRRVQFLFVLFTTVSSARTRVVSRAFWRRGMARVGARDFAEIAADWVSVRVDALVQGVLVDAVYVIGVVVRHGCEATATEVGEVRCSWVELCARIFP